MTAPHPSPRPEKSADAEALYEQFRAADIAFTVHRHDAVFTVEEARALRGDLPGAHCKNLFLKDKKGALYLIVCLEDRRVDMKALSQLLDTARLSFGRPELLFERLGVEPGSVTPFAVINDAAVNVVLDAEMMQAPLVNYHPLVNTATVAIAPSDLIHFLEVCRHTPRIVDLTPATRPENAPENAPSGRTLVFVDKNRHLMGPSHQQKCETMEPIIDPNTPQAAPPTDLIKDTTEASFMQDVIEASKEVPVIVDFWAPWCGPCKQLGPMLESIVTGAKGAVRLVKIDIDQNQQIAQQLRIQSIPAVYAFYQGKPIDAFQGALPESELRAFVDKLVKTAGTEQKSPVEEALEQATTLFEAGDTAQAGALYAQIAQHDPACLPAKAGMARCLLATDQTDKAREIVAALSDDEKADAAFLPVVAALDLADKAAAAGDLAPLRAAVEADPANHQARFDLALALYAGGEKEKAMDALVEIIRRDRGWNDDGARKQLLEFFEAMGPTDPMTVLGRRKLSTVLFS